MKNIKNQTVALMGGDARICRVAEDLCRVAQEVRVFSISGEVGSKALRTDTLERTLRGCDTLVLPLPLTFDGSTLFSSAVPRGEPIILDELLHMAYIHGVNRIFGGRLPRDFVEKAEGYGISITDYYLDEGLIFDNAIPTAEGAIMLTMQEIPRTIEGLDCVVVGYGRIGKVLAKKLSGLGAIVTVMARRSEVLCEAYDKGYDTCNFELDHMLPELLRCDIVYNTVPARVICDEMLEIVSQHNSECIFMELASSPGGFDPQIAEFFGYKVISAPGLPGKYAPTSAGDYIFRSIMRTEAKGDNNV